MQTTWPHTIINNAIHAHTMFIYFERKEIQKRAAYSIERVSDEKPKLIGEMIISDLFKRQNLLM